MADRQPRQSTDQAPLLRDHDSENGFGEQAESSFKFKALTTLHVIANERLTPLSKVLVVVTIILSLLTSVFIGLLAGSHHKLTHERARRQPGRTLTATVTSTRTKIGTPTGFPLPSPTEPHEEICLTTECIVTSAEILSSLDTSQDPCENFYEFSNGGWLQLNPVPASKSSYGSFEVLAVENKKVLRKILEGGNRFSDKHDGMLFDKLQGFYDSCIDEERLNKVGDAPLRAFIDSLRMIYSGNTMDKGIDGTVTGGSDITAALTFLHSHGIDALFSFIVEGDVGVDPDQLVLWFYQPSLGLPSKEYFLEESVLDVYRDAIQNIHRALQPEKVEGSSPGPTPFYSFRSQSNDGREWTSPWAWPGGEDDKIPPINETERILNLSRKMVKFEIALANASLDLDILKDPFVKYNPVDVANLTSTLSSIKWGYYFSTFTSRTFSSRLVLTYPPFAESLAKLLDETDAEVIEFYLITKSAFALAPYLGIESATWKANRALVEALTGVKKGAVGDRREFCIQKVEDHLGMAAGRYFVNETFPGDSKEKAKKVIKDIIDAFVESLGHLEWMDKTSANSAAEKAKTIQVKVGYPSSPDTNDPYSLLRYYHLNSVHPEKFFENALSAVKATTYRKWSQLGRRRDHGEWKMYPSIVDAYYSAPANEIVFPAGILQLPFFSSSWPSYLVYGAFGQVAAHELTHAFDSAGRLYNQEGKLEEWWTNATSEGFNKIQTCIVDQYASYSIDDGNGGKVYVNGNLTSGENIGDSGIIQAYRAWKSQFSSSFVAGNEFLLPGLNFTREQMFFIAFGRIWARDMKPAAAIQQIRTDPHSPSKYRVEGSLANVPEFAKAFGCKVGSKLNPPVEEQCRFWG
ncbi:endothelin-converting enzyme 1 [Flagelloscypha sp. PMI_526]|nr:endothelin-converting enzyme 1 [Flagelloscypha sp. PMI_526]